MPRKNRLMAFSLKACAAALLLWSGTAACRTSSHPASGGHAVSLSSLCLLDGKDYQNRDHVLGMLGNLEKTGGNQLAVTPFMPFLAFKEGEEEAGLADFLDFAKDRKIHLVVGLAEEGSGGRKYHAAVLIGPDGRILGKYRKTHRTAIDEPIALGDDLPVFDTAFGKIGLTLTTDFYYPEIYEVLRMKGARILVWQDYPERFREHFQWLPLLYSRAMDSHAFLVTAHYADPRTYIANNYDYGMKGAAFGRSMIIDRSGTPRADTGYRHGIAAVTVDLDEKKDDPYSMTPNFENLFYVPNNGGRAAFGPIAEKWEKPALPEFSKRKARIAVAFTSGDEMWNNAAYPEAVMGLLEKAWEVKPDLILFSENNARRLEDPAIQKGLRDISAWAARHRCYVAVGGIAGPDNPVSTAYVWDRAGRLIYTEPLYWMAGAEELKVFDTDFGRLAAHSCGDLFQFPIDRVLALKGAELILDPSQMWGPDGYHNELLLKARAVDNGVYLAVAHWNTSDPGLRSMIVDPYGSILAGSGFLEKGVIYADIDFSREKVYYAGLRPNQPEPGKEDIPSYFTPDMPEQLRGWRQMIFGNRRPELYSIIPTDNDITRRYIGKELQKRYASGAGTGNTTQDQ